MVSGSGTGCHARCPLRVRTVTNTMSAPASAVSRSPTLSCAAFWVGARAGEGEETSRGGHQGGAVHSVAGSAGGGTHQPNVRVPSGAQAPGQILSDGQLAASGHGGGAQRLAGGEQV